MNEKMERSLSWLGLTIDEQAKVYQKLPAPPKKYGEFYRIAGEIYFAGDDSSWFVTIPNEYRNLYPDRFAYQEGKAEEPAFIHTQVIECLTGEFNENAVLEEYIGVKREHIGEFSICWTHRFDQTNLWMAQIKKLVLIQEDLNQLSQELNNT